MKSKNSGQNNKLNSKDQLLENKAGNSQSISAQKDGIRYDYTDSSDFNNNKMS